MDRFSHDPPSPLGALGALEITELSTRANKWRIGESGWKMEVHIGARGDRGAIERSGLIVTAAERICNLFVDPVPDSLDDLGFDYIAGRVDCHLDDDVADDVARKRSTVDGRVGGNDRICDVHLMAADRSIDHGAEWRACAGVMVASVCIGDGRGWLRLWSRLRRLGLRKRPLPAGLPWE